MRPLFPVPFFLPKTKERKQRFFQKNLAKDFKDISVKRDGFTDAHNGKLWAESEGRGKGTNFFIELPVGGETGKRDL